MEHEFGSVRVSAELLDSEPETVRSFSDVKARYSELAGEAKEHLYALYLNSANQLLGDKLICLGSSDRVRVDIKDIARAAVLVGAEAVILVHNHPSGVTDPSEKDVKVTREVRKALDLFDVDLLDHVIFGRDDCRSMRGNGDLTFNGGGL